ncbi:centrosomin isoform X2 [Chelonus insularis]|uniref:centrosomin isoform X2 n=1 Tax=Chelonus insularis TaxID=460826 RepID=UPI00158B0E71|nr:centrosomin isoform X2 [Chelonus insularis]
MFFGGNTSYYGRNSPQSPAKSPGRGKICSPFRNTQMPLQEITMNQTRLGNGTSTRSPGKVLPAGAMTMKDYEEHLEALKSENFQLKLRVFFLEERMGIISTGAADEDPVRKNIKLKVEIEALKKELIEKQKLLSQAAKAFELYEEQKEVTKRNEAQYEESLENRRLRIIELEKELEEYREKLSDTSIYYQEAFGISPEIALENKEKLNQMEELVRSLEMQVEQLKSSLDEERTWGQEMETERDELRARLEEETQVREKLIMDKDLDIETLRAKVKELEEEAFRRESVTQQYKTELAEKDRIIKEKISLLEEKCRACEELNVVAEKRKKQVDQLRLSVKSRDEALADTNNKYRTLLNQFENNRRFSPPSSPSTLDDSQSIRSNLKSGPIGSPSRVLMSSFDWDSKKDKAISTTPTPSVMFDNSKEINDLKRQLEEKDQELEKQNEEKKRLILKLCNVQQSAEHTENELNQLKPRHEQALKMIQRFCLQQKKLDEKLLRKEQKKAEMQQGLKKPAETFKLKRNDGLQKNIDIETSDGSDEQMTQQRFEELEAKINDLRDEITSIKAEKVKLKHQVQEESKDLQNQLESTQKEINNLDTEKNKMDSYWSDSDVPPAPSPKPSLPINEEIDPINDSPHTQIDKLKMKLFIKDTETKQLNKKIEELTKDLQVKTQNLQKLVNTELWSKNKEIAKLHNHMTANQSYDKNRSKSDQENAYHLNILLKELNECGVQVEFNEEAVHINFLKDGHSGNVKTMIAYIEKLNEEKTKLQSEVDSLTWFTMVSKADSKLEIGDEIESRNPTTYCELLRTHLIGLIKFMKATLSSPDYPEDSEQRKIILEFLANTKPFSENLVQAVKNSPIAINNENDQVNHVDDQDQGFRESQSDSETYSEPDRSVSKARMGLKINDQCRCRVITRHTKTNKNLSDSEDSLDYIPFYSTSQHDLIDNEVSKAVETLRDLCHILCTDFDSLRNELVKKCQLDDVLEEKLLPAIFNKLEKSVELCDKVKVLFEKKIHEYHDLMKSKQHEVKKLEDDTQRFSQLNHSTTTAIIKHHHQNDNPSQIVYNCREEIEELKTQIQKLKQQNDEASESIAKLTKDLDRLTLAHSQVLVDNTKLTNEKLKLEQELRKSVNRYESTVRSIREKFNKEVAELNQMNGSHRTRMQDLEATNKELRRRVLCETSDSAPSSSGVSSIPTEINKPCDDILQEFHSYNSSQYWLPTSYPSSSGRSKSSCSPDLGIESDAAASTRPLKDTLKITESMTNLLSDEENCNTNALRDLDRESPLQMEGLDEVEALKQENEALKKRLLKTRKALEDTFKHLSASNRNKKNVEKAITKQLMITKSILNKTRTYEDQLDN